jgi:hypothetical protein
MEERVRSWESRVDIRAARAAVRTSAGGEGGCED